MRKIMFILVMFMFIANINVEAQAQDTITVIVDGREVKFTDAPAYIDASGSVQVPSRPIGEALGAFVNWNELARRVNFSRRSFVFDEKYTTYVDFQIDSANYYVRCGTDSGSQKYTMDTKVVIKQGCIYVPVRYVAEALGAQADWDGQSKTFTITSKTKDVGGLAVPQSYIDEVHVIEYEDGTSGVGMGVDIERLNYDIRIQMTLDLTSQILGADTVEKLNNFMIVNREFDAKDRFDYVMETFWDSRSGRYVRIMRLVNRGNSFSIFIYDEGITPGEI